MTNNEIRNCPTHCTHPFFMHWPFKDPRFSGEFWGVVLVGVIILGVVMPMTKHDPNLIYWQIAQYRNDPSEAVQACCELFTTIARNKNRQFDCGLRISNQFDKGEGYEPSSR